MMLLQAWLNKMIKIATANKYNWNKYWLEFKKWEFRDGKWGQDANMMAITKIHHYLRARQITNLGNLKEIATKFIINEYHDGKSMVG